MWNLLIFDMVMVFFFNKEDIIMHLLFKNEKKNHILKMKFHSKLLNNEISFKTLKFLSYI